MLTRLFVFLLLLSSVAFAQNNITANRLLVKDSLSLKGKWIGQINNDSTLSVVSEKSISTDAALMKYINQATTGGGSVSPADIARMVVDPNALQVEVNFGGWQYLSSPFNFDLNFLSSDGIKSTYRVFGRRPSDVFTVYGKPPFSLYTYIVNETADSLFSIGISSSEQAYTMQSPYANFILVKPGDTAYIPADGLRSSLMINIEFRSIVSPGSQVVDVTERIKNHSASQYMLFYKDGLGSIALMPGKEISQHNLWFGNSSCYVRGTSFHVAENGYFITSMPFNVPVRISVYRNGVLFTSKDIMPFKEVNLPFVMDATWVDYEIILEDIHP